MEDKLSIVDVGGLSEQQKTELDKKVDELIKQQRDNQQEVSALVDESMTALTAGNKFSQDISKQGILKRFWGRISGSNARKQDDINADLLKAQYAAQQLLQKLAEQNLLTLELVVDVNNKLNAQMTQVNAELNNVYSALQNFFQKIAQRLNAMQGTLDEHGHRLKILTWVTEIKRRKFDGIAYKELDDAAKIVCLVRDFVDLTAKVRLPEDYGCLETATDNLGLADKQIILENFIAQIAEDNRLYNHLFGARLDRFATEDKPFAFEIRRSKEEKLFGIVENGISRNSS